MTKLAHENIRDFLAGVIPVSDIDAATWRDMESWAKQDLSRQIAKVDALCSNGKSRLARRTARLALQRVGCRFAVAAKVLKKVYPNRLNDTDEVREAKRISRMSAMKAGLPQIGRFKHPASAQLRPQRKKDGSYRPLLNFYWIDKAQQSLLGKIYTPFADFHPSQYQRQQIEGLGGTAAVREALCAKLDTVDNTAVFMHVDISRFYDSINVEWLECQLWLPRSMIRRHAHTVDMSIASYGSYNVGSGLSGENPPDDSGVNWKNGRLGIPQGSALSPVLGDLVMADLLRTVAVPEESALFTWSDNIGVVVPQREAANLEELFRSAFAEHGAGPFEITVSQQPVTREFKFLGYWFRRGEGKTEAFVPETIANAWAAKFFDRLTRATSLEAVNKIERVAIGKLSQWGWWSGIHEYREEVINLIQSQRDWLTPQVVSEK